MKRSASLAAFVLLLFAAFGTPGASAAGPHWSPCEGGTSIYVSGNTHTHGYHAWDMVCMDSAHRVTSPVTGKVVFQQDKFANEGCSGLGNVVVIRSSANKQFYVLGHLMKHSVTVSKGQVVRHGEVVGVQDRSGQVTGEHVHIMRFTSWYTYTESACGYKTVWGEGETGFCFRDIGCPATGTWVTSGNYPPE